MRAAGRLTALALCALLAAGASGAATKSSKPKSGSAKSASKGKATPESLQVLVRLGKETITRSDVNRRLEEVPEQFRANYSTPEGRQQLLDRMVEERVWMIGAQKAGVPERPQVKRQLEQQRRDFLIRTYLNEVMASNPAPSDSEARIYYDQHMADYRIPASATVKHIQLKSESDAKKVLGYARKKQDWNKLAQKYSTDTLTKANGGQLGSVTRDGIFTSIGRQPALAESVFTMKDGQIGGPWKSDRGWHVMMVETVRAESTRPFDQVKPLILRSLSSTRSQDYYKERLDGMKRTIGVTPDSAAIHGFLNQKKTARDMFKDAQEAGPAAQRIELYQRLLQTYPESEVSPQAQFMIGFIQSEELKDYDAAEKTFRTLVQRYPKSELVASAQWMIDHMRSEEAPSFLDLEHDSTAAAPATGKKPPVWKPSESKKKP